MVHEEAVDLESTVCFDKNHECQSDAKMASKTHCWNHFFPPNAGSSTLVKCHSELSGELSGEQCVNFKPVC